jgi:hypothetical protein
VSAIEDITISHCFAGWYEQMYREVACLIFTSLCVCVCVCVQSRLSIGYDEHSMWFEKKGTTIPELASSVNPAKVWH